MLNIIFLIDVKYIASSYVKHSKSVYRSASNLTRIHAIIILTIKAKIFSSNSLIL